jgi:pimeloyl-ACP methyl ester carboxylesterase
MKSQRDSLSRSPSNTDSGGAPTLVLLHGSAHTSQVWGAVRQHLAVSSIAVDLPGRRDRPGVLATVTIADSVASVLADLDGLEAQELILVGHSAAGVVMPALAAALGSRVAQLIFVAGVTAPEGRCAVETTSAGRSEGMQARLEELRRRYPRHMLGADMEGLDVPAGYALIPDQREALSVEALNRLFQPMSWDGVGDEVRRVFVRCLADPIQSRAVQSRLIEACGAELVVDIDSGHNPALEAPSRLAEILDSLSGPAS